MILDRIHFSLDELKYIYLGETVGNGETASRPLNGWRMRVGWRYPKGTPEKVMKGLEPSSP